jgi:hypothetical protein
LGYRLVAERARRRTLIEACTYAPSTAAAIGGLSWRDVGESCDVSAAA